MKTEEKRSVLEVTAKEKQEMILGLQGRVSDIKGKMKPLEALKVPVDGCRSELAILLGSGDGKEIGLIARLEGIGQGGLFEAKEPVGKLVVRPVDDEGEMKRLKGIDFDSLDHIRTAVVDGRYGPNEMVGRIVEDAAGDRFRLGVQVLVGVPDHLGTRCIFIDEKQKRCMNLAKEGNTHCQVCIDRAAAEVKKAKAEDDAKKKGGNQKAKKKAKASGKKEKSGSEEAKDKLTQKRFLASQKLIRLEKEKEGWSGLDLDPMLRYFDRAEDEDFLDGFLGSPPETMEPKALCRPDQYDEKVVDGVMFVGRTARAEAISCELSGPLFWEKTGTGKDGGFTKGNVQDVQSDYVSWLARRDEAEKGA